MKKILIIGNSFGDDAVRYLYGISRAAKKDIKVVNLFIGGCSLYRHYRNMLSGEKAYDFRMNGISTGLFVSLSQGLLLEEWDIVVMQQCSPKSGESDTYYPFITELSAYVKKLCPKAKQLIQMTWSFAEGAPRFKLTPFDTREEMIPMVRKAYTLAAESIGADAVIPSLDAMNSLYDVIGENTYRDGFHCNMGITRYMLGCLWFMAIFGKDIEGNTFRDFDVEVTEDEVLLAQRIAKETALKNGFTVK